MKQHRNIDLTGEWIFCYLHQEEYQKRESAPVTYHQVENYTGQPLIAQVPGNFELDLQQAGLLPDLFFGENTLLAQEYEDVHIFYAKRFDYLPQDSCVPKLVFEGLDTITDVYLNGQLLGHTDNMFVPHEFYPAIEPGEQELVVHIHPAALVARDNKISAGNWALKYNFESLRLRKAAHCFGWDIMPRIVSAGIFRPVFLGYQPVEHIAQSYLMTTSVDVARNTATLRLFYDTHIEEADLSKYSIQVEGHCGDSRFSAATRLWFTAGRLDLTVEDAKFWWPKGYGAPNLYQVSVTLLRGEQVIDQREFHTGIRTVDLIRTSTTDVFFSGKFHFEINGEQVFVMGSNFVPIDAFHSRDRERLPKVMELADDIGINMIRCWGGNLYEDPYFFDFCDRYGIMIWQDFAMACGRYPIDQDFSRVIEEEATTIVRQLRQHPSLVLWAGDNEVDQFAMNDLLAVDPNQNHITRRVLADVVAMEDPVRPYLPSSPYVDEEAAKLPIEYLTENHLWGPRDYFRSDFYSRSLCNFVSEIGYHGCPSVESMEKFIDAEYLWPWQDNPQWQVHAASPEVGEDSEGSYLYRIELMAKQIGELFGQVPENLDDFVLASQVSQAEAKKHFIELFRTGRDDRTGIIWWNLMDGWPQFSDAVVDYYFDKKLAYHYIKQVQQPICLAFTQPEDWHIRLQSVNDTGIHQKITYRVWNTATEETVLEGTQTVPDGVFQLGQLAYSQGAQTIYGISWEYAGQTGKNHYLAGNPAFLLEEYKEFLQRMYPEYQ